MLRKTICNVNFILIFLTVDIVLENPLFCIKTPLRNPLRILAYAILWLIKITQKRARTTHCKLK